MHLREMYKSIFLPVLMLLSFVAFAQNKTVTGRVTDPTGKGVPGVTVIVKGQSGGVVTADDGSYTISVPANATTLVVSSVGFTTQELSVAGRNEANVSLQSNAGNLNEVVVVGYGTRQRRDLTGSVTTISEKDFNRGQITTPEQLIAGKVAGVQIVSNGGAPGAGSSIRIRGGASLSASNDPLIVIDGVPVPAGGIAGAANPLALINPNDIESYNVLKDAAATAIYGSRASNGVIIITTKKGRSGKPVFAFNSQFAASTNPRQVEVLSAAQLRDVVQKSGNAAAIAQLGTANTNWQDEIYRTALTQDLNMSVTGAAGILPYRLSVGFLNQDGVLKTSNLQRTSAALNLNPSFFQNHLRVNVNVKGAKNDTRFANQGAIGAAIAFNPTVPVYSGNRRFGGFFEYVDPNTNRPNTNAARNPVGLLMNREDLSDVVRSIGNIQLDYRLHFFPDLRANLNLGYDAAKGTGTIFVPDSVGTDYLRGGVNNRYRQDKLSKLMEGYFTYNKDVASIRSRFDATAGYSYQDFKTTNYSFADFNARLIKQPGTDPQFAFDIPQNTLISFFSRLNYTFNNKYLLTASIRRDGSSRFNPENRWGWFPAAAFAWRIKDEGFLRSSRTFSDLKLRLGYGVTGQQDIGLNYSYLGVYGLSNNAAQYQLGDQFFNMYRPNGYNPNLKWEETETYNAGLDFGFINNRINGTIDVYFKRTTDLLNNINQPAGANFSNVILANIGSMENRGVELNLNANPVRTRNFSWDANFNLTYNRNRITKLTAVEDPNYPGVQFGGISGGINNTLLINSVGSNRGSFYVFKQVYNTEGKPIEGLYADLNGDGIINQRDLYRYKSADPTLFGGFSSNLTYNKWNGGFTIRGSYGNYMYNNVYSNTGVFRNIYNLPNMMNNASVNYLETGFNNNQFLSDYYLENAAFIRMDNIYVGYNLGELGRTGARVNLNATVQNVFVITEYKGLDPEISGGIDNSFYPRPRVFSVGLNVNF